MSFTPAASHFAPAKLPQFDEPRSAWSGSGPFQCLSCFDFDNLQLNHSLFIDVLAMPTVTPIDEPNAQSADSPTADQVVSNHKYCRLPIVKLPIH